MIRLFPLTLATLVLVLHPVPTMAQTQANAGACTDDLHQELVLMHQQFRSVLFGTKPAEEDPIGTVVHLPNGSTWYKASNNAWQSVDEGFENTTYTNTFIDGQLQGMLPIRKGIFETRGVTTSELLPYIGVSLRAFQCQLYQFCDAVDKSKSFTINDAPQNITAIYPGCVPIQRQSIASCHINETKPVSESIIIYHSCEQAVQSILNHEAEMLNLAVQYDAAYRSLLQIAGNIDLFLEEFHWPIAYSLRSTVDIISTLGRIPCFISSCEAFPPKK